MIQNPVDNFGLLHFLGDVSAFEIQITAADITAATACHSFYLEASSGCKIDWGDGVQTAWTSNTLYTHTYAKAGIYLVQIKGPHTHFYHATGSTATKVIQAVRLYSGLTSCSATFYDCYNDLFHIHPAFRIPDGVTSCSTMFYNCHGRNFTVPYPFCLGKNVSITASMFAACYGPSFCLPESFVLTNKITNCSQMCYGDYGAAFTSLPSGFMIPPSAVLLSYMMAGCYNLAANISGIFPDWAAGSTVDLRYAFRASTKLTGTVPSAKLWDRTDVTFQSTETFYPDTTLTNYTSIPAAWGGGGA